MGKCKHFKTGADLLFQDELHGPLITMSDRVMDLLYTKYFRAYISYEGIQRVENFPVPRAAMREAVLNAIVHRDYSTSIPTQIMVLPDQVILYNDGGLPREWTLDDLLGQHGSRPRNPGIAGAFFHSGQIETWGRGIEKIEEACRTEGKPPPIFRAKSREISVTFPFLIDDITTSSSTTRVADNQGTSTQESPPGASTSLPTSPDFRRETGRDVGKLGRQVMEAVGARFHNTTQGGPP